MEGPIRHDIPPEAKRSDQPTKDSGVNFADAVDPDDDEEIDSELQELRDMDYNTDIKPYQPEIGKDAGVSQQPELRLPVDDEPFDQKRQDEWERQRDDPDDPDTARRGVDTWEMSGESEDRN